MAMSTEDIAMMLIVHSGDARTFIYMRQKRISSEQMEQMKKGGFGNG